MKKGFGRFVLPLLLMFGFAHAQPEDVTYVYTDPQGTPLAEADANGNITATFDYGPYGGRALGSSSKGPGYTGHVNDPETGFIYMQARYYEPGTGRFVSVDPVGSSPSNLFNFNRYDYANNNPVVNTDPDGRCVDADWSCGAMARSLADHPEARKPMEPIAKYGVGVMLSASGLGAVVETVHAISTIKNVAEKIANTPSTGRTYTTYTRTKDNGTVYSGRTSGKGTPQQQVAVRTSKADHQAKTAEGYGPARVDKNSSNPDAIRGREQQLIEQNGGARSQGGTSGNAINGVSPNNPNAARYSAACKSEFGCG